MYKVISIILAILFLTACAQLRGDSQKFATLKDARSIPVENVEYLEMQNQLEDKNLNDAKQTSSKQSQNIIVSNNQMNNEEFINDLFIMKESSNRKTSLNQDSSRNISNLEKQTKNNSNLASAQNNLNPPSVNNDQISNINRVKETQNRNLQKQYVIQLGVFSIEDNAKRLKANFDNLFPQNLEIVNSNSRYKVLVRGFQSYLDAKNETSKLDQMNYYDYLVIND